MFIVFRRWPILRRAGVVIFALPLMFAGGSLVGDIAQQSVGGVGTFDISQEEFYATYQNIEDRYRRQYGFNSTPPDLANTISEQAQSQLTSEYLLRAVVADKKIYAPDAAIAAEIRQQPDFQDESGAFSLELFNDFVPNPRDFKNEVRRTLERRPLMSVLEENAISSVIDKVAAYRNQQRIVERAVVTVTAVFNIGDNDISRYYAQNRRRYEIREEADWEYIRISANDFIASITADAAALSLAFDELSEEYGGREQRNASHIFIEGDDDETEQRASELAAQARAAPDTFGDLAREFSDDFGSADSGGELGVFVPGDLPPAMDEALFALEIGEISAPVVVDGGFSIIRLDGAAIEPPPEDELRAQSKIRARQIIARERTLEFAEQLQDIAHINIGSLVEAASLASVAIQTVGVVPRIPDATSEDFWQDEDVLSELYLNEIVNGGETSNAVAVSDDDYILARVLRYQPSSVRPLTEVSEEITKLLNARHKIIEIEQAENDSIRPEELLWTGLYTVAITGIAAQTESEDDAEEGAEEAVEDVIDEFARTRIFRADLSNGTPAYAYVAEEDGTITAFRIADTINAPPSADVTDNLSEALKEAHTQAAASAYLRSASERYNIYFNEDPTRAAY